MCNHEHCLIGRTLVSKPQRTPIHVIRISPVPLAAHSQPGTAISICWGFINVLLANHRLSSKYLWDHSPPDRSAILFPVLAVLCQTPLFIPVNPVNEQSSHVNEIGIR